MKPPVLLSQSDRQRRRHAIAEMLRSGASIGETALHFGVSVSQVHAAAMEHGAPLTGQRIAVRTLRIIADLLHADLTQAAIAQKHGCSNQRVSDVAKQARAAGILQPLTEASA
jgi:transposase-like protein